MNISRSIHRMTIACMAISMCATAGAQGNRPRFVLDYIPHSTAKVEQIIGDYDWADLAQGIFTPTTSKTIARLNIAGTDTGSSFEHEGSLIFLFGDTISNDPSQPWGAYSGQPFVAYKAGDPMAWSHTRDGDAGLLLNFLTVGSSNDPLFVQPPGVPMGADDVPNSGISLNGQIPVGSGAGFYIVCNTGSDVNSPNPHQADYSVLTCFDERTSAFYTGRTISKLDPKLNPKDPRQGHFIFDSMRESPIASPLAPSGIWMFGVGEYRESDVYLSYTPANSFWNPQPATIYFGGYRKDGTPIWVSEESKARPVVYDNPLHNQKPWPNDNPTIGNVSVTYSSDLQDWLMTFDGGRQEGPKEAETTGVYFCYSLSGQPWGPWSLPELIFNATRDDGNGDFIHDPQDNPSGPAGPVIGKNSLNTPGGTYAPLMIERFTRIKGDRLTIYYTMSTWNPYTVILMKSDFLIRYVY